MDRRARARPPTQCDITYGTNSEFGFDYLRDNLAVDLEDTRAARRTPSRSWTRSTRSSIDEARTPLIIAGQPEEAADTYYTFAKIVKRLKRAARTTRSTRSARPSRRPSRACTRSRRRSASRTSTRPGSSQMVNHLIQALRPSRSTSSDVEYLVVGRRGQDRRRVHRPHHGRPPLVGGPAPGRRGQGGRQDRGRERHGRDGHDPELLPPLREARRHDRHGAHRGQRVPRDLQARGRADPDQRAGHAHRPERPHLQDRGREVPRGRERHRGAPREGPAGARRHDLGRGLRALSEPARAPGHPAQRAQRQDRQERRRPRSSRTRARRARSRSRPTWPAAASTSSSARACSTSAAST